MVGLERGNEVSVQYRVCRSDSPQRIIHTLLKKVRRGMRKAYREGVVPCSSSVLDREKEVLEVAVTGISYQRLLLPNGHSVPRERHFCIYGEYDGRAFKATVWYGELVVKLPPPLRWSVSGAEAWEWKRRHICRQCYLPIEYQK